MDKNLSQSSSQGSITDSVSKQDLVQIARAFFYVGVIGFGGGLAILAQLQRHVVEKLQWLTNDEFVEATTVIQSLPGVIAVNISCYIGFKLRGWIGGLVAVVAMLLPAFASMLLLSEFYLTFKEVPDFERLFRGMTPAIAAFILVAAYKLGQSVICSLWDWPVAILAFLALSFFDFGVIQTVLIAGGVGLLAFAWKGALAGNFRSFTCWPICLGIGLLTGSFLSNEIWRLLYVFLKIGAFTFGGGYVMVPFLEGEVVRKFGWLNHREFVDSVALGQITPGPVVITATFVGYKVLGMFGACLATIAVFLPSYCLTLAVSFYYQRFKSNKVLQAFLRGISPSVVGMLASATFSIGRISVHSWVGFFIALATLVVALRFKVSSLWVILAAGGLSWFLG
jgi:chromate transporter